MLTQQIIDVLNDSKFDDNRENSIPIGKVMSLFDTLIIILGSVECFECRQNLCKSIEDLMPAALKEAMQRSVQEGHHLH
jgi:hypothetical protein